MDILFYMQVEGKSFQLKTFPGPHNLPKISNFISGENPLVKRYEVSHRTGHGNHRKLKVGLLIRGAFIAKRICDRIS